MTKTKATGVVVAGTAYSLTAFTKATGLGRTALREARRQGLPVRRVGLRSWVLGSDWLEFLATKAEIVAGHK